MMLLRKVPKGPRGGRAYESRKGRVYIGWGGNIYLFHFAFYRFEVSVAARHHL